MGLPSTASTKAAAALAVLIFAGQVYRAATTPISVREAYLYDRFVRPTIRQVLASELPDRGVLYAVLEKRSVGLFHVSPFSVRLPGLLFGILFLAGTWRIARAAFGAGWRASGAFAVAAALTLQWDWFWRADGTGTALALLIGAGWAAIAHRNLNLVGICFGLSVCADSTFLLPALAAALAILAARRDWTDWSQRVLIPGAVVAWMVLVLPLTHAGAPPEKTPGLTVGQCAHLRAALDALRASATGQLVSIGGTEETEPVIDFYRAQHRAANWQRPSRDPASEHFDYYLIPADRAAALDSRHVVVVYRDRDFVVARRTAAAM